MLTVFKAHPNPNPHPHPNPNPNPATPSPNPNPKPHPNPNPNPNPPPPTKANTGALRFYEKHGYTVDESSPSRCGVPPNPTPYTNPNPSPGPGRSPNPNPNPNPNPDQVRRAWQHVRDHVQGGGHGAAQVTRLAFCLPFVT